MKWEVFVAKFMVALKRRFGMVYSLSSEDVKAKALSVHDDITKAFSELSPSKFKLTDEERKRFERARLSEEQSKKVSYVLGGPVNLSF